MPYVNLSPNLQVLFSTINDRLNRLETMKRFTAPSVATDPTNPRPGDIWLNTTSNTLKATDKNNTVKTITWV
jgi:hypothetical protein